MKILDLTVRRHSSCFPEPSLVYIERERGYARLFVRWNWEFSSVCWLAVHILHCRLLIKKRTEQISVLLYEWTREKHNRSSGVAADHVISTELRDHKFSERSEAFRIYSFDDGWNNGADQVACRPASSPETDDGTRSTAAQSRDGTTFTEAQSRDGTTSKVYGTADWTTITAAQRRDAILVKLFDVQKYGTGEDDSSTHHPQLLSRNLLHLIRIQNCGLTTGQDSAHLWWWMLYLSNARHKFSLPIKLLLYTKKKKKKKKKLANLAAQQTPSKYINKLTILEIADFMKEQFDPKLFIVRGRFKFWRDIQRKPGQTLQELAAGIRQDAATCDFPSTQDPQDETLR